MNEKTLPDHESALLALANSKWSERGELLQSQSTYSYSEAQKITQQLGKLRDKLGLDNAPVDKRHPLGPQQFTMNAAGAPETFAEHGLTLNISEAIAQASSATPQRKR